MVNLEESYSIRYNTSARLPSLLTFCPKSIHISLFLIVMYAVVFS